MIWFLYAIWLDYIILCCFSTFITLFRILWVWTSVLMKRSFLNVSIDERTDKCWDISSCLSLKTWMMYFLFLKTLLRSRRKWYSTIILVYWAFFDSSWIKRTSFNLFPITVISKFIKTIRIMKEAIMKKSHTAYIYDPLLNSPVEKSPILIIYIERIDEMKLR